MDIFECSPEELAGYIAKNDLIYLGGNHLFKELANKGIFSRETESALEKALQILNQANQIARESKYFLFKVYDSWAEEHGLLSEGYELFQKVNNRMIDKVSLNSNGAPELEQIIDYAKKRKINEVFTLFIPTEGYCGLERLCEDEDEDIIKREILDESDIEELKDNSINVIITQI